MVAEAQNDTPTQQVSVQRMYSTKQLSDITSFADAWKLAVDTTGIGTPEDLGDGFNPIEKSELVNVMLLVLTWTFSRGEYADENTGEIKDFATVRAVTADGRKVVFADGSTGICDQLRFFQDRIGQVKSFPCRGLIKSEYTNEHGPAVTYYFDTRPPQVPKV